MKFIIFSDCHYGYDKGAKISIEEIVKLYENKYGKVDKIIILGDFIDLWRRSIDEVLIECENIFDFLESRNQDVIYVKGNHDFIIDELLKNRRIKIVDNFKFGSYIFEHGHYIDYLSMDKPFVSIEKFYEFAKEMCYSDDMTGGALSRIWNIYKLMYKGFGSAVLKYFENAESKFTKMNKLSNVIYGKYNKLVIGHFHTFWSGENLIILPAFCEGYFTIIDNDKFEYYKVKINDIIKIQ